MRKAKVLKWVMMGALALTVMSGTGNYAEAAKGTVSITKKNFPCKELRAELKKWYDLNDDGKLTKSEARRITSIQISTGLRSRKKISLKGMKKLKLTNCKKLRRLDLTPFDMKSLDIKGTTGFRVLNINTEAVRKIDVSKMKNLRELSLRGANITKLSVKKNKKLEKLNVSGTKIKTLDLSAQTKLENIELSRSNVEELDIRNSLLVCDHDEGGSGIGLSDCKKLRKIIVNKELKELKDFQDSARQDGLNIEWVTIQ